MPNDVFFEAPNFDWEREGPELPPHPYVVMELVRGEALQVSMDRDTQEVAPENQEHSPLSVSEKCSVLEQATQALEYLAIFGLIHRDFRGCNMHLVSRNDTDGGCKLKVLDLGVMICAENGQELNYNLAVQAFRGCGETEEKRRRYDWLPWEVREGADGIGPRVNFAPPVHSFDVFSLGVLVLHLLVGKTKARVVLDTINSGGEIPETASLNLDSEIVRRMLGEASQRPDPNEIFSSFTRLKQVLACREYAPCRSRSREPKHQKWQQCSQPSAILEKAGTPEPALMGRSVATAMGSRVALELPPTNDCNEDVAMPQVSPHAFEIPTSTQTPQVPQSLRRAQSPQSISTHTKQSFSAPQTPHTIPPWQGTSAMPSAAQAPMACSASNTPFTPPIQQIQVPHVTPPWAAMVQGHPEPQSITCIDRHTFSQVPGQVPPLPWNYLEPDSCFFSLRSPMSILTQASWMAAGLATRSDTNGRESSTSLKDMGSLVPPSQVQSMVEKWHPQFTLAG